MTYENAAAYNFEVETGYLAEFSAAKDDGSNLEAGVVGELAEVEIGGQGNGSFSAYRRIAFGGIPERHRQNAKAKVSGNLQGDQDDDGTVEDVPSGTQVRLVLTDHQRNRQIDTTEWYDVSLIENSDPAKKPTLQFAGVQRADWAADGRVVLVQVRNQRQGVSVSYSDSTMDFPYVGAY